MLSVRVLMSFSGRWIPSSNNVTTTYYILGNSHLSLGFSLLRCMSQQYTTNCNVWSLSKERWKLHTIKDASHASRSQLDRQRFTSAQNWVTNRHTS